MKKQADHSLSKTQVFNVIILDRSGSMNVIRQAAVDGFNETLAGIKMAQKEYDDTQEHYVTLVTFCSCSRRFVFDCVPVAEAHQLSLDDYEPCCTTPLYDAMGLVLTSMRHRVKDLDDAVVVVTIITDGLENASKEYSQDCISRLVKDLRKEGWTFTYMGANQDAVEVANTLSIRNARNFEYSAEGATDSMYKDVRTRLNFFDRLSEAKCYYATDSLSPQMRRRYYSDLADEAFDEVENQSDDKPTDDSDNDNTQEKIGQRLEWENEELENLEQNYKQCTDSARKSWLLRQINSKKQQISYLMSLWMKAK